MVLQAITLTLIIMILALLLFLLLGWRWLLKVIVRKMGKIIYTDSYQENLIELIPGFKHMGIQNALENNLRSETGDALHRPLGAAKNWPHLESITFIPAQVTTFPVDSDQEIDIKVLIGPKAKKPLELDIPLLISGMAYGVALSAQARLALAEAAKQVNTAINTGEGPVLPEELELGGNLILQFSKTSWSKDEQLLKQADMIEIKFGQGSSMGMGAKINPENLTGRAREIMGLEEEEVAHIYEHFFENQTHQDLQDLVVELRELTKGVPIGAKIGASGNLEEEIDTILDLDVDFIAVDGGQGATHGSPAILTDGFGIPTFHAVVRASNHLKKREMKGKVSLIVSGGLFTPAEFLKVIALGADAVYLGSAMLFSMAHSQTLKALPFEPPTQVVWNEGKFANLFNKDEGVQSATNFLNSSVDEMKVGIRALGKKSINEISKKDLVSFNKLVAKIVGVPYTFEPMETDEQEQEE